MRVRRIKSHNFQIAGGEIDIELPETGVVVVTGPNGHGKSSLVESVAFALWGETLRGRIPWVDGVAGKVTVRSDAVLSSRSATPKGSKKLLWNRLGEEPVRYKSATESQRALSEIVGSFETWRRCSVFSSHDASTFSNATDRDRKLLLEGILGGARFDDAVTRARAALSEARARAAQNDRNAAVTEARIEETLRRKKEAEDGLAALEDAKVDDLQMLEARIEKMSAKLEPVRSCYHQTAADARGSPPGLGEARAKQSETDRRLAALRDGKCPTCGAAVSKTKIDGLRDEVERLRKEAADIMQSHDAAVSAARDRASQAKRDLDALEARLRSVQDAAAYAKAAERSAVQYRKTLEGIGGEVALLRAAAADHRQKSERAASSVSVLAIVERVLGLRGVRTHVLGRALSGVEAAANSYLDRIGGGLRLGLSPTTEKKTGGVSDAISVRIDGAGGGDYAGSSGGQRRRIDIATVLGLSELSDAALGVEPGDLWFDEVFDALDEDGVDGVSRILVEMGEARKVIVISHNRHLTDRLRPGAAAWLQVKGGRLRA